MLSLLFFDALDVPENKDIFFTSVFCHVCNVPAYSLCSRHFFPSEKGLCILFSLFIRLSFTNTLEKNTKKKEARGAALERFLKEKQGP